MAEFEPVLHPWNQEIWQSLTNEPERANHALLFCGERGLGKRSLAQALAHFTMTEHHHQSASLFAAGSHPDLHVILPEARAQEDWLGQVAQRYFEKHSGKPKKQITIDQVRKLSLALQTHSHISPTRVILIFSCEQMNASASNALLKSLEEPPANTLFVLVTDELSRLPATIRSRCSMVPFRTPTESQALAFLTHHAQIPEAQLSTYLSMANNQPLMAIELFESQHIDLLKQVFKDVNGLWMQRVEPTQIAQHWLKKGPKTVVNVLQKLTNDLLRCQLAQNPPSLFYPVQYSWLSSSAQKLSRRHLLGFIDELSEAKRLLNTTVDELLILEALSIKVGRLPA